MATTAPQFEATQTPKTTYRAAVVHDFEGPLTVEQVAPRELEPGQVRVKVEASGLCHTDIHAAHGDWPVKPSPPFVPGHEGVGIVTEISPGVTEVAVGDRVAMPWLGYACGACDYCVSGWETLCLEQKNMGYSIDGSVRRVRRGLRSLRRQGSRRARSFRRCAAHLRRRHDLQGRQGRGHALVRPRRRVRRGRARPHGDPVRGDRRRAGRSRSTSSTRSSSSPASSARSSRSTRRRKTRPKRSSASAAPTRRSRWPSRRARSSRPSPRFAAAARWSSSPSPPTTRSSSRSSRPSSTGSPSSARSSVPAPTCARSSSCTPPARRT